MHTAPVRTTSESKSPSLAPPMIMREEGGGGGNGGMEATSDTVLWSLSDLPFLVSLPVEWSAPTGG